MKTPREPQEFTIVDIRRALRYRAPRCACLMNEDVPKSSRFTYHFRRI